MQKHNIRQGYCSAFGCIHCVDSENVAEMTGDMRMLSSLFEFIEKGSNWEVFIYILCDKSSPDTF